MDTLKIETFASSLTFKRRNSSSRLKIWKPGLASKTQNLCSRLNTKDIEFFSLYKFK